MGLPVVTFAGRSFASRVCSSLVRAAGIGELACASREEYAAAAVAFASNRPALARLKRRLDEKRDSCRLFDTATLVGELENAFRAMHADYAAGRRPTPNLNNVAAYHEIGLAMSVGELDDSDYLGAYADEMARRDAVSPLAADGRTWVGRIVAPGTVRG